MSKISWCDVVKAIGKYANSMTEFNTIYNELDSGSNTIEDYPGLYDILIENLKNK